MSGFARQVTLPWGRTGRTIELHRHDENGLQVILAADPRSPVISYQTWLAVGSASERPGKTGLAHFFEHLMFTSTRTHELGEFDRLIESVGGDTNAATWLDWTYYRDSVPAGELELCVALEADRLANLELSQGNIESEREVIINERRERVDDDIDGFLDERLMQLTFGADDPYGWPTIGWMRDIERLELADLESFYRSYYAPDSATVVIAGGFDPRVALEILGRYYAPLPASGKRAPRPSPLRAETLPPSGENRRAGALRESYDKPVSSARCVYSWRIPGQSTRDWAVLDLVGQLLTGGPSARLYRELVIERELASTVSCGVLPLAQRSALEIAVTASARAGLDSCDEVIARVLGELAEQPVDADELGRVKAGMLTDFWTELTSADGMAEALGHHHLVCGDFRQLFEFPATVESITAEEIREGVREHLRMSDHAAVMARPAK